MKLFYQIIIMFVLDLFTFIRPVQKFASYNTTTNANVIPTFWARKVLEAAKPNLILTKMCDHSWKDSVKKSGDTVTIPKFGEPTVVTKVAGTPIATRQGVATTTIDVKLDQHLMVPLTAEDTALLMSEPDAHSNILKGAGIALAKGIENYIWTLIVTHGAASASNRLGTFLSAIDQALMQDIKDAFDTAEAPVTESRECILGVDGISDIMGIANFMSVQNIGETQKFSALSTGKLPMLLGVNYHMSQLEPVSTADRSGVAFIKPAIAVVSRSLIDKTKAPAHGVAQGAYLDPDLKIEIKVTQGYSMNDAGGLINVECLMGAKIVRPEWVKEIRH